jgi:D-alanyl-D-alanine carboxypeptidase
MMKPLALGVAALSLVAQGPGAAAGRSTSRIVDDAAAAFMAKQGVPGIAVAVVRHGAIVYERGYGYADRDADAPAGADTRFEIGSITKQMTAACIVQQVRAGHLSLEDRLEKFIPDYPAAAKVTVRQLLGQSSGIPEYAFFGAEEQPQTAEQIVQRVAAKPLEFPPGTRFSYSNTNYALLGHILELVSREPFADYVRAHIFAPAHMTHSAFTWDESTLGDIATGYVRTPQGVARARHVLHLIRDGAGGDGAVVSTAGDLARWDIALSSGAILPASDVALMQTPVPLSGEARMNYGMGWVRDTLGGHLRVSHNGGTDGFAATNAVFPHDDEAIVVLGNIALASPARLAASVFSAEHPDVTAVFNAAAAGEDKAVTARLREMLRRLALGQPDRSQFAARALVLINPGGIAFLREALEPLGPVTKMIFRGRTALPAHGTTPAMSVYSYNVAYGIDRERVVVGLDANNKVTAFGVLPFSDN